MYSEKQIISIRRKKGMTPTWYVFDCYVYSMKIEAIFSQVFLDTSREIHIDM